MWAVSDPVAYEAALRAPTRQWQTRVDVLYGSDVATTLDVLVDGSVALDDQAVRRSCSLTLLDPTGQLAPASARDLLAPKGTEVLPYRGLVLPNGQVEWVPLGVMAVVNPKVTSDNGTTRIALTGHDRVDAVRLRRFDVPYSIAAGTLTDQAIAGIVTSRLAVPVRVTPTGHTCPALVYDALSDPWDAVRDLAAADDLVAYFDPLGALAVAPDLGVETGVTYAAGPDSLMVLDGGTERTLTADNTYSGVVVTGEHPDSDPVRVTVWDTNPNSPTYAYGPFGKRPYGFSSTVITSVAQATATAQSILARVSKMRQEAVLTTVGHPGHDLGDIITVTDLTTRTTGRWQIVGGAVQMRSSTVQWKLVEAVS